MSDNKRNEGSYSKEERQAIRAAYEAGLSIKGVQFVTIEQRFGDDAMQPYGNLCRHWLCRHELKKDE